MQKLFPVEKADMGRVHNDMSRVLHSPYVDDKAGQVFSNFNAGSDPACAMEPWPGCSLGIRAPGVAETPLSISEVEHYLRYVERVK